MASEPPPNNQYKEYQRANKAKQQATVEQQIGDPLRAIVDRLGTFREQIKTDATEQERKQDARHKENLYWFRFNAVSNILLGILTFLVGGATVWVLFSTWVAIDLQRKDSEATQRAFVSFSTFNILPMFDKKLGKVVLFRTTAVWENSGTTPTRRMTSHVNKFPWDTRDILPKDFFKKDQWDSDIPIKDRKPTPLLIGPHGTLPASPLLLTLDNLRSAQEGKIIIYLWGWARYRDVFEDTREHITRFCYQIDRYGVLGDFNPNVAVEPAVCPTYSCADEDCDNQK